MACSPYRERLLRAVEPLAHTAVPRTRSRVVLAVRIKTVFALRDGAGRVIVLGCSRLVVGGRRRRRGRDCSGGWRGSRSSSGRRRSSRRRSCSGRRCRRTGRSNAAVVGAGSAACLRRRRTVLARYRRARGCGGGGRCRGRRPVIGRLCLLDTAVMRAGATARSRGGSTVLTRDGRGLGLSTARNGERDRECGGERKRTGAVRYEPVTLRDVLQLGHSTSVAVSYCCRRGVVPRKQWGRLHVSECRRLRG